MPPKAKSTEKLWRVMRSFDAFNEGETFHAPEDDWIKGRRHLLREVKPDADPGDGEAGAGGTGQGG